MRACVYMDGSGGGVCVGIFQGGKDPIYLYLTFK